MSFSSKGRVLCLGLALVVLAAYANHFQNDFHFDDTQTVVANPYIRTLANVPRFFKDATLFSVQVGGQAVAVLEAQPPFLGEPAEFAERGHHVVTRLHGA